MQQQMVLVVSLSILVMLLSVIVSSSSKAGEVRKDIKRKVKRDVQVEKAFNNLFRSAEPADSKNEFYVSKLVAEPTAPPAKKVMVEVYYEALCPYCQAFMGGALTDVLSKSDLVNIIDLKLVPYGNTHVDASGSYHCQHGVGECMSDVIMQCTLYKLGGDINAIADGSQSLTAWPFFRQLVVKEKGHPVKAEQSFKDTLGQTSSLSWATVIDCYKHESNDVQKVAADATPPHQYTAWVVVNHKHLDDANTLLSSICAEYLGEKPPSCAEQSLRLIESKRVKQAKAEIDSWGTPSTWTEEVVPGKNNKK